MRGVRLVLAAVVACALLAPADQELPRPRFVVPSFQVSSPPQALAIELNPPPDREVTITLSSSDSGVVRVPPAVTALRGARYAFVCVGGGVDPGRARLSATLGGETTTCEVVAIGFSIFGRDGSRTMPRWWPEDDTEVVAVEAEETPDPEAEDVIAPVVERAGAQVRGQWASNQVVDWTCDVPRTGFYGLFVDACCDEFLDVPECGVVLDGKGDPIARAKVSTTEIERFPLEPAVKLEAGKHALSFRFLNDAYDPETQLDRNLYLDRIGFVWVGDTQPDDVPPRVGIRAPRQGEEFGGPVDVLVDAWDAVGVSEVRLFVNDQQVAASPGSRLATRIALPAGVCNLRAVAVDAAGNEGADECKVLRRAFEGEAIDPPRWIGAAEAKGMEAQRDPGAPTGACLAMYASEPVPSFIVRCDVEEEVEARVLARADLYEGPPTVELDVNGQVLTADVAWTDYQDVALGRVRLGAGENRVEVRFPNDAYGGTADTDRNLFVAAIGFGRSSRDEEPPTAELVNVPPELSGVELIVARASDNGAIANVELQVDGDLTQSVDGIEPYGMWLDTETLPSGRHRLSVRARDTAGNEAISEEVEVEIVRASHTSPLSRTERGVHILNRLGMGYSREALERLLLSGEKVWLEQELLPSTGEQIETAEFEPVRDDFGRLLLATLARLQSPRGEVRERMALFWDNHFSTFVHKTHPQAEWNEYTRFRKTGLHPFRSILDRSAHSAAMLTYLDNQTNRKGHPNENYAREIMELHTLGVHGGYTQKDVEEVTRVLTGWAADVAGDVFAYIPQFHDEGEKRALGMLFPAGAGKEEGEWLLEVLAAHPATARFVCGKLAAMWVSDDPPEELLDAMVQAFLSSGGDIATVLRATVDHPAFFDRKHFATKVKDPLEFVMGLSRHGAWAGDLWAIDHGMVRLGRRLYECQPPTGYKERAEEWLSSAALLTRWNLAEEAASHVPLGRVFPGGWGDKLVEEQVDEASFTLLGRRLSNDHRKLVLEALEGMDGVRRVRAMIALVLQMPEGQMN